MSEPFAKNADLWWRFSKMEVRDNYLQPAAGAKLEWYEPWELHWQRLRGEAIDSPLDRLLAICTDSAHPVMPDVEELIAWSEAFGPLGVLLMRTVRVVFPPLRKKISELPRLMAKAEGILDEQERARIREAETWLVQSYRFTGGWFALGEAPPLERYTDEEWLVKRPARAWLRPEWTTSNQPDEVGSLSETWGRYFPSVPPEERDTFQYPRPDKFEDFARLYREPLTEWATWAKKIANAVQALGEHASHDDRMTGALVLATIAAPVRQTLDVRNAAHPQLIWRSPALGCSLAHMAMQRIGGGERVRACKDPECGVLFLPGNARAEYHDDRCRWRHHKAEQRAASKRRGTKRKGKRHG